MTQGYRVVSASYTPRIFDIESASDHIGRAMRRPPYVGEPTIDLMRARAIAGVGESTKRSAHFGEETDDDITETASNSTPWPTAGLVQIAEGVHKRPNAFERGIITVKARLAEFHEMIAAIAVEIEPTDKTDKFIGEIDTTADPSARYEEFERRLQRPTTREIKRERIKHRARRPKNSGLFALSR